MKETLAASLGLMVAACSVDLVGTASEEPKVNACVHDGECRGGRCRLGACVAPEGDFDTVLLEVTPPADAEGLGGARFLKTLRGNSRTRTGVKLNLTKLADVRGFVKAYDSEALASCLDGADATLPVRVTLTPREQILGLPAASHVATTRLVTGLADDDACVGQVSPAEAVHEFALTVPAGDYDVYVQPLMEADPSAADGGCELAPYVSRSVSIPVGEVCLPLSPPKPQTLSLVIDWPAEAAETLDQWTVDLVHPITGHRLSARRVLDKPTPVTVDSKDVLRYELDKLPFSLVSGDDYSQKGEELVRLTPPEPTAGPVIQLVRGVLQAGETANQAVLPPLQPFPAPVKLESWVWQEQGDEVPVAATVTLTATALQGVPSGIFPSFSAEAEVGDDGRLSTLVLPGEYRARVVPTRFQGADGEALSATEQSLSVRCARKPGEPDQCAPRDPHDPVTVQAGRVLLVPPAATLSGRVRFPASIGSGVTANVVAAASQRRARACKPESAPDAGCSRAPVDVLETSLGEDAFLPRTVNTSIDSRGRFALEGMDCGGCKEGEGSLFDVTVRPADGSRMPWLVRSGVEVGVDRDLGDIEAPLPILQQGALQLVSDRGDPIAVPAALIRAYIFRDQQGDYVADPESFPSCAARDVMPGERCIRSVLQIAETRVEEDGSFELALPAHIDMASPM